MDGDADLASGLAGLKAGNIVEAERRFRRVLKKRPAHPEALHMLGLIAHRKGQAFVAAETLQKAIESDPESVEAHYHLAEVLRSLGEGEEAVAASREAVRLDPESAPAHNNLGLALQDLERLDEAEASLRAAVANDASYGRGHFNLGNVLRLQGSLDEAELCLRKALELNPRYPQALNALGVVLGERRQFEEASECFHRALGVAPNYVKPLLNLGNLMARLDRFKDAHACFDRALQRKSDYFEAWLAKATTFHQQERYTDELESLRRASRLRPEDPAPHFQIGIAHITQYGYDEAARAFEKVLKLDKGHDEALANLLQCRLELCQWDEGEMFSELRERVAASIDDGKPSPLGSHAALFLPFSPSEQLSIARSIAESIVEQLPSAQLEPRPERAPVRLRIGYLSSDFRNNAVAHLIRRLFAHHDKSRFEIFTYSIGPDDKSEYRQGIAADSEHFIDLAEMTDEDAARRIQRDGVHILVDLVGFAGGSRIGIPARRPAPLSVTYLGYPGTLGGVFHDYVIGDPVVSRTSAQKHFGEKLVVLPHSYQVNDDQQPTSERVFRRAEEGLPESGFIFCCFNRLSKIEPEIFDVWMRILERVPESVLWLLETTGTGKENLKREAEARGVSGERLFFSARRPKPEHLARQKMAGLFLDTRICNAHTSASDTLWAGVPLITCPGETFSARVAASLLTAIGLPELIVEDLEAYEELAIALATDPPRLEALKEKLLTQRDRCPLFDTSRSARNLERAYLAMWARYEKGEAPDILIITEE